MEYTEKNIAQILNKAVDKLFEVNSCLLRKTYDINERTISHRLALHLNEFFSQTPYYVDIEYNRFRDKYKMNNDIGSLMSKNFITIILAMHLMEVQD